MTLNYREAIVQGAMRRSGSVDGDESPLPESPLPESPSETNIQPVTPGRPEHSGHFSQSTPIPSGHHPTRRPSPFPLIAPNQVMLDVTHAKKSLPSIREPATCSASRRQGEDNGEGGDAKDVGPPCETEVLHGAAKMGACASKKPHADLEEKEKNPRQKSGDGKAPVTPVGEKQRPNHENNCAEEEEEDDEEVRKDASTNSKFKFKRDSIAVTKVRMMRTQVQTDGTIGEEDEDEIDCREGDEDEENDADADVDDRVRFNESMPNDSGLSLNSCPDNGNHSLSSVGAYSEKFPSLLSASLLEETCPLQNVSLLALRSERIDFPREYEYDEVRDTAKRFIDGPTKTCPARAVSPSRSSLIDFWEKQIEERQR